MNICTQPVRIIKSLLPTASILAVMGTLCMLEGSCNRPPQIPSVAILSPQLTLNAPKGIPNVGNTCYMNSVLQIIAALYEDRVQNDPLKDMIQKINSGEGVAVGEGDVKTFIEGLPEAAKALPKSRKQYDAAEFIQLLNIALPFLEGCDLVERNFIKNKDQKIYYRDMVINESDMLRISFQENNDIAAIIDHSCSTWMVEDLTSSDESAGNHLYVDLKDYTVMQKNALPDFVKSNQSNLSVLAQMTKGKTSGMFASNKIVKRELKKLPNRLCVSLKRFDKNNIKINNKVTGTDKIQIKSEGKDVHFTLSGFIVHMGTTGGGHYVAYVKKGNTWYLANDATVTKVDNAIEASQDAYLLFYTKPSTKGVRDTKSG